MPVSGNSSHIESVLQGDASSSYDFRFLRRGPLSRSCAKVSTNSNLPLIAMEHESPDDCSMDSTTQLNELRNCRGIAAESWRCSSIKQCVSCHDEIWKSKTFTHSSRTASSSYTIISSSFFLYRKLPNCLPKLPTTWNSGLCSVFIEQMTSVRCFHSASSRESSLTCRYNSCSYYS